MFTVYYDEQWQRYVAFDPSGLVIDTIDPREIDVDGVDARFEEACEMFRWRLAPESVTSDIARPFVVYASSNA